MRLELVQELDKIRNEFAISDELLLKIVDDFLNDMTKKSMLRMLNSYVFLEPENVLEGEYLTIDIGGSNIRICKVNVSKDNVLIDKIIKFPLKTDTEDYTSSKYSLKDLLVMTLEKMEPFLEEEKTYKLSSTISFPLESTSINDAKIISLAKGFELSNTIGEDINNILLDAINSLGLNIIPVAIVNDVVATLASGKFFYPNSDIAFIVGTGYNSSFIDKNNEVINMESTYFCKALPQTSFDRNIEISETPIGGKRICELANAIVKEMAKKDIIEKLNISTEILVDVLNREASLKDEKEEVICEIAKILFERSAKFIVAEAIAIIKYIDKEIIRNHTIVIDGSVYEKCNYFKEMISKFLKDFLGEDANKLNHIFIKDASTIGPAIVSACLGKKEIV